MKKLIFCVTMLCISFFSQAAEAPKLPTRGINLGDTGAEVPLVKKQPSIDRGRRDSNGTPFSATFLREENLIVHGNLSPRGLTKKAPADLNS